MKNVSINWAIWPHLLGCSYKWKCLGKRGSNGEEVQMSINITNSFKLIFFQIIKVFQYENFRQIEFKSMDLILSHTLDIQKLDLANPRHNEHEI